MMKNDLKDRNIKRPMRIVTGSLCLSLFLFVIAVVFWLGNFTRLQAQDNGGTVPGPTAVEVTSGNDSLKEKLTPEELTSGIVSGEALEEELKDDFGDEIGGELNGDEFNGGDSAPVSEIPASEPPLDSDAEITSFPIAQSEPAVSGCPMTKNESLWGGFAPGSWIRTRTTGVCTDGKNNSKSITETKWTLLSIESDGVVLQKEVTIKMGVASHVKEPEVVKYDFLDMLVTPDCLVTDQPSSGLTISRKVIPCKVCLYVRPGEQKQEEVLVWYSSVVSPHVLQKESRIWSNNVNASGNRDILGYSKMTVAKTSSHVRIGNTLGTWRSQTTTVAGASTTTTKTFYSSKIPGGVLKETSVETASDGTVLYHSNTVLLDYFARHP